MRNFCVLSILFIFVYFLVPGSASAADILDPCRAEKIAHEECKKIQCARSKLKEYEEDRHDGFFRNAYGRCAALECFHTWGNVAECVDANNQ